MTVRWWWVACLFVGLAAPAAADKVIRGVVRDAETGDPLPSATVQILNAYEGTIANAEGAYELLLHTAPVTVEVRYIGYRSQTLTVTESSPDMHDFSLAPAPIVGQEIVVTPNAGADIMRKVIAQKQVWHRHLDRFEVDAYSRFVFKNHKGIVSIIESASEAFWDRERGWREVIKARRQTSNMHFDLDAAIPAASAVTNLYDDNVEIAGHHLIGVTNPDALDAYDFELTGRRFLHDQVVYDIAVTPKNRLVSGFEGRVSVLDSVFALVEVDLKPGKSFLFPPPVNGFTVAYKQQFRHFKGDVWLPVDFQFQAELNIGLIGLHFPPIKVDQVSRLSNYRVNVTMPDSLYKRDKVLTVDSVAVKSDSLLTRAGGVVPLSEAEEAAYARIDSSMTLEKAYRPTGVLARFIHEDAGEKDSHEKDHKQRANGDAGRHFPFEGKPEVWFDRVDGAHLGAMLAAGSRRNRFEIRGSGAYNVSLKRWAFSGEATARWGKKQREFAILEGFRGTDVRFASSLYSRFAVSPQQVFGSPDYFDFFWNQGGRLHLGYRFGKPKLTLSCGLNVERQTSVVKTTDWSVWQRKVQRANPAIDPGDLRSISVRAVFEGENDGPAPFFGQRRVTAEVEHSRPGLLHSDFSFTQYRLVLDWRFPTFLRRRLLPNVLDVRVVASTYTGVLPRQKYGILDAALGRMTTFGAFRSARDRPFEGAKVFGVFWEHNFRTVPFELLGWQWAAEHGIGLIVHGADGRTWISDTHLAAMADSPLYLNRFYHELGVSINGLFNLFRVDFTKRLDAPGFFVGVGLARIF